MSEYSNNSSEDEEEDDSNQTLDTGLANITEAMRNLKPFQVQVPNETSPREVSNASVYGSPKPQAGQPAAMHQQMMGGAPKPGFNNQAQQQLPPQQQAQSQVSMQQTQQAQAALYMNALQASQGQHAQQPSFQ